MSAIDTACCSERSKLDATLSHECLIRLKKCLFFISVVLLSIFVFKVLFFPDFP